MKIEKVAKGFVVDYSSLFLMTASRTARRTDPLEDASIKNQAPSIRILSDEEIIFHYFSFLSVADLSATDYGCACQPLESSEVLLGFL